MYKTKQKPLLSLCGVKWDKITQKWLILDLLFNRIFPK
jgi:hypothetical protein